VTIDSRPPGVIRLNALDYLLSNAVGFNHPKRAQWLLRHGANANCMQAYSKRPLREEALVRGHISVAELTTVLLAHGADAGLRNNGGITAGEAARKRGLDDAADLMRASRTGGKKLFQ
jgi:hypothetical protein